MEQGDMEMTDLNTVDDDARGWSSDGSSNSGSEGEVSANVLHDQSCSSDINTNNNDVGKYPLSGSIRALENQPWSPNMSLLDLAFKLKEAEARVFGLHRGQAGQHNEPVSEEETDESDFEERCYMPCDEKSEPGQYGAGPSNSGKPQGSAQNGDLVPLFVDIKAEEFSDSNFDDSALEPSKTPETASYYDKMSYDASQKQYKCTGCAYQTDSKSHLLRHQRAIHQGCLPNETSTMLLASAVSKAIDAGKAAGGRFIRRHRCELCNYQTDSKSHLRRHQGSVHSKKKPFKCHLCKMEFSRSEKAKEHFMNVHSDVPYDARKMRKFMPSSKEISKPVDTFTKIKQLYKELESTNGESSKNAATNDNTDARNDSMIDVDGDDEFSLNEMLEKSKALRAGISGNKPFTCLKCDYASRDIWHLKRHISDVHLLRKDYKCKICTYATNRQHRFVCHMRTHGEIFCFYCDYSNIKLDVFKQHMQLCSALHKMSTEVQCRLCETDCGDHSSLKDHMITFHGAILYSCDNCAYYSEILEDFESHTRIHEEEDRTCKLCNIVFKVKPDLAVHCNAVHIRTNEDGLLVCLVCQHHEASHPLMLNHILQHAPQVFSCDVDDCLFKATTSKSLALHAKYYHDRNQADLVNANEQTPSSSSAAKLSKENSALKSMALGTYTCPICSERPPFRYRKSFEKHLTQHAVEAESCPLCKDSFFLHKELQEHALAVHGVKVV